MSSIERVNEPPDTYRLAFWVWVRRWLHIPFQPALSVILALFQIWTLSWKFNTICHLFISLCTALCRSDFFSFTSRRLMLLSVSYLLLTLALSPFFHFFPSFFVFSLGLLSGASWGNAWSLSVCATINVLVFLFVSHAFLPVHLSQSFSMHLQQPSSLS